MPLIQERRPWTVTELNACLKRTLECGFPDVIVQGEISNLKLASSQHLFFSLKDAGATVSAVMFKSDVFRLRFQPKDGMEVVVRGRLSVYPQRGQYQIVCGAMEQVGAGALAKAFEALKARLKAEGLFDEERKRPLPFIPRRIGLVTSPAGAALHDFLRILHARYPASVLLAPAAVQGAAAPGELVHGLRLLERSGLVDLIVLTRGGGSMEDLWAFNDEGLARAIAACSIPVVSAVGHEVDFTIADFVADRRCATPTDAARTVVPVMDDLREDVEVARRRLRILVEKRLLESRARLDALRERMPDAARDLADRRLYLAHRLDGMEGRVAKELAARKERLGELSRRLAAAHPKVRILQASARFHQAREGVLRLGASLVPGRRGGLERLEARLLARSPLQAVSMERARVRELSARLARAMAAALERQGQALGRQAARLDALSPFAVLSRGFSLTYDDRGRLVRSSSQLRVGDVLSVALSDQSRVRAAVLPGEGVAGKSARPAPASRPPSASGCGPAPAAMDQMKLPGMG